MQEIKLNNKIDLSDIKNIKSDDSEDLDVKNTSKSTDENEVFNSMNYEIPKMDLLQSYEGFNTMILSPEEQKEKRKKIIKIKNYLKTFPDILVDFVSIDTKNMSLKDLDDMIEEIRLTVSCGNNSELLVNGFLMGCNIYEKTASYMGVDLDGFSNIVSRDQNIIKCIKEISLEYQNLNYIPPEKRLIMMMFALSYGVYNMNNMKKHINYNTKKNINDEIINKYNDL